MIIPFIIVDKAIEAMNFYEKVLNATIPQETIMYSEIPGFDTEEYLGKVSYGTLLINDTTIFIKDKIENNECDVENNIQLVIDFNSKEELEKAFYGLSKEGHVVEDMGEKQWCELFVVVKDKYNIVWQMYYGHK